MMYYRRKILFSILEAFGGRLSRTQMQKLAFIFTRWQEKKAFDFVPYRFGCYSFQLNKDLQALTTRRHLEEQKANGYTYWSKLDKTSYTFQLQKKDQELLARLVKKFQTANQDDLIEDSKAPKNVSLATFQPTKIKEFIVEPDDRDLI